VSERRRLAFARARTPVAVAMQVVAAALAALAPDTTARRSVFVGARSGRRAALHDEARVPAIAPARGCEDLH